MKKNLVLFLFVFLTIGCKEDSSVLIEEEETNYGLFVITPDKAKEEALQFVSANKPLSKSSEILTSEIQTVSRTLNISASSSSSLSASRQLDYSEQVPVYLISLKNGDENAGYVVTAGDKRVPQRVLAFSDEGEWDLSGMEGFEEVFWNQVDAYLSTSIAESDIDPCDNYMYEDVYESTKFVSDFRIQWGQSPSPYNDSVLVCSTSGINVPAGCVAVAMGQIMSHHGRPLSGTYTHPQYNRTVSAQYNWTTMKASASAQYLSAAGRSGVANILAAAGTKVYMSYGCNSSGAYDSNVPQAFSQMGYTCSSLVGFNLYQIVNNLDINYPVYMRGTSNSGNGHAWVVEGYRRITYDQVYYKDCPDGTTEETPVTSFSHYLYFNLGWHGQSNGFYLADSFSTWAYPQNINIIYNIHPN
jgi:hypothetical protein